jgi:general secretion pathway protein G
MQIRMFRSAARSSVRGFTLLEMMLVVVIMGVLIGVAAVNILGRGKAAKIGATKASMSTTASMIKNYNLEQGVYPATLDNLVPKYMEKIPLDAWKRSLIYIPGQSASGNGAHPFTLYSTGESGESNGPDLIDYWDEEVVTPH